MTEITNIDQLHLDGSETLESSGFSRMSLKNLFKNNETKHSSKGLNSLLGEKNTFASTSNDDLLMGELLSHTLKIESLLNNRIDYRKPLYVLSISLIVSSFLFSNSSRNTPVPTENKSTISEYMKLKYITNKFANLRSKPSSSGMILTVLSPQSEIEVLKEYPLWYRVKSLNKLTGEGTSGYIWKDLISKLNAR